MNVEPVETELIDRRADLRDLNIHEFWYQRVGMNIDTIPHEHSGLTV